jgi:hypothetical protein
LRHVVVNIVGRQHFDDFHGRALATIVGSWCLRFMIKNRIGPGSAPVRPLSRDPRTAAQRWRSEPRSSSSGANVLRYCFDEANSCRSNRSPRMAARRAS